MSRRGNDNTGGAPRSPMAALATARGGITGLLGFLFTLSGMINILALTGSLYMLQVYDRALTSQSVPTLLALSTLALGLYVFYGMLDVTRSQVLTRLGAQMDHKLAPLAHSVTIDMPRFGFSLAESKERSRDVETLRQFLAGPGPTALFDLPWMPVYIAFVYMLHPWLGMMAVIGGLVLAGLTVVTELVTRSGALEAQRAEITRANMADAHVRNAEVLRAMGFAGRAVERFAQANAAHLRLQNRASAWTGGLGGVSKVLRMILQSAVLGLGAYLTIGGELSAGAIIAASVATSRALSPVDLAIGQWKVMIAARRSYRRRSETLRQIDDQEELVALPAPSKHLKVENITIAAPSTGTVVLADVNLELKAGEALGLIGPSGGGKSSFARGLTGVWPLVRGDVRLDDVEIGQWRPEEFGKHVGYLPQDVMLLDATVAENIGRLEPEPDSAKILAAANAAGVHEMIVRLPDGYQTRLGPNGVSLSAGQRQRLALARALYGDPFLVVLDEPNSNLDHEGDQALTAAIEGVKARGGVAVVVTHRPSGVHACDYLGVVKQGRLAMIGPKNQVLEELNKSAAPAQPNLQPKPRPGGMRSGSAA